MPKIKPLPASIISLIAAGEVAESPAIIVKELIENSIDAKSSEITLELIGSTLEEIVVIDNGIGIPASELALAVERHTTSKIAKTEDLSHIQTLGFRGEALASIAHVSQLSLSSRCADTEVGYKVTVKDGLPSKPVAVTHKPGTMVHIENLFYNVPVRKKFLKSPTKELKHILWYVMAYALSFPSITFKAYHDKVLILKLQAVSSLPERITELFKHRSDQLFELKADTDKVRLSGVLGSPQIAHPNAVQFLFVNQRLVVVPQVQKKIKAAYGTLLEKTHLPFFILNVELDPETIDIHVHPHKETARFQEESALFQTIQTLVNQELQRTDLFYTSQTNSEISQEPATAKALYPVFKNSLLNSPLHQALTTWQPGKKPAEVLQVSNTYLVFETPGGLVMIDQHAAHERILYEQFKNEVIASSSAQLKVPLIQPLSFTLSPFEKNELADKSQWFAQLGLEIETFGKNTCRICSVPTFVQDLPATELETMVRDLLLANEESSLAELTHDLIARLACRLAIQAGDPLSQTQRWELIEKLSQTPNQFTCPHGRPTLISHSQTELEKMFKRRK